MKHVPPEYCNLWVSELPSKRWCSKKCLYLPEVLVLIAVVVFTVGSLTVVGLSATGRLRAEAVAMVQPDTAPPAIQNCIPNYAECTSRDRTEPCCLQQELPAGQVVPEDFICFHFGLGVCQPLSSIDKLEMYAQSIRNSNGTNLFELLGQYYKPEILANNATELDDSKP